MAAPHFALSRVDAWDNFVAILSCGLTIQKWFDNLDELLAPLLQELLAMSVASRSFSGADSASWRELWARYSRFEELHLPELIKQLETMSGALQSLQADVDLKTYAVVNTSRQMRFEVEESFKQYVDARRRIAERVARLEFSQEPLIVMYAEMKHLQAYTRRIRAQVGDLNSNTLRIITEWGGIKEGVS